MKGAYLRKVADDVRGHFKHGLVHTGLLRPVTELALGARNTAAMGAAAKIVRIPVGDIVRIHRYIGKIVNRCLGRIRKSADALANNHHAHDNDHH